MTPSFHLKHFTDLSAAMVPAYPIWCILEMFVFGNQCILSAVLMDSSTSLNIQLPVSANPNLAPANHEQLGGVAGISHEKAGLLHCW